MQLIKKAGITTVILTYLTFFNIYAQNQPNSGMPHTGGGGGMSGNLGNVSGIVVDKLTSQAVEYANLVLFRQKDSSMVNGAITNQKGQFTIEKVPFGKYYMVVSFIGYSSLRIPDIMVNPKEPNKNLGQIKFEPSSSTLGEVNITAEKRMMEYSLDKKVVNVDKNLVSAGGSAVDVMQNIPAVTVDIDGNVSLRGSTNVNILVDGRPSNLSGMSRQAILEQIPASSIEAIEIITNPSAKYNPDGMSGIINIKLKKKTAQGLNGLISTSIGTGDRYNSSVNLNYSTSKFNIFSSWDGRWFQGRGYGDTYRKVTMNDTSSYTRQHSDMKRKMNDNSVKLGFDWYINRKNTLTISGQIGKDKSTRDQNLYSYSNDYNQATYEQFYQKNIESEDENSNSLNLNYKKTFEKKNRELTADFSYSKSKDSENTDMNNHSFLENFIPFTGFDEIQQQLNNGNSENGSALINYILPFNEKLKLETGFQGIYRKVDNDFQLNNFDYISKSYVIDTNSVNHFIYTESINAVYGTLSKEWDKVSVQIGLRLEQAFTTAEQITQVKTFENNYFSIYPTLHISKKLPNKNEMQFSYSRRVNRPNIYNLNPFKDYSNPLVIDYGNPYLKPEYINSFELGHSKYWNKSSFYTSIYYRQINDVIKRISYLGNDGISYMTSENLSKGTSYGVDLILEHEITKWWRINANFSYFRTLIEGNSIDGSISTDNYSWTSKLNSNMTLLKNLTIQISANYRAPIITPQGKMYETYSADIAMKKDFMKDKFSVSLRVSDIFNTQRFDVDAYGNNFYSTMYRKRQSQAAFLTLSYKINGGLKQKAKKKIIDNSGGGSDEGDF